jgi:glutamate synthase domain-containing protein 3
VAAETGRAVRWEGKRNDRPEPHAPIDDAWVGPALAAYKAGVPFNLDANVSNEDRTLGARLAGQIARYRVDNSVSAGSQLTFNLKGTAGQSLGAFATTGMTLHLEGIANDFVGKGLCGGELIIRGRGRVALQSEAHTLLGNVALYGATSGSLFAAGRAGERFGVRNSGARAIVEGVGDHGCEYMTGGLAVVLGRTGINFGAGMTGGLAWVYDEDGDFLANRRFHAAFLQPENWEGLDGEARESIRELVALHAEKTGSTRAEWLLKAWGTEARKFVRLTPKPQA